jgi:hypothetical protein
MSDADFAAATTGLSQASFFAYAARYYGDKRVAPLDARFVDDLLYLSPTLLRDTLAAGVVVDRNGRNGGVKQVKVKTEGGGGGDGGDVAPPPSSLSAAPTAAGAVVVLTASNLAFYPCELSNGPRFPRPVPQRIKVAQVSSIRSLCILVLFSFLYCAHKHTHTHTRMYTHSLTRTRTHTHF